MAHNADLCQPVCRKGTRCRQPVILIVAEQPEGIDALTPKPWKEKFADNLMSYNRDFLDNYVPNKTAYVPKNLRKQLLKEGKRFDKAFAAGTYLLFSKGLNQQIDTPVYGVTARSFQHGFSLYDL